jgi:hypothetical protein
MRADDQDKSLGRRLAGTKNSLHLPSELLRVPVEIGEHIKGLVEEYKDQCKRWVDEGRKVLERHK